MKKLSKELVFLFIQLIIFYIYPLIVIKSSPIGMVLMMIIFTFLLSMILGFISNKKIKFFFPLLVGLSFIPSIFIYYNESALIHSVLYFCLKFKSFRKLNEIFLITIVLK